MKRRNEQRPDEEELQDLLGKYCSSVVVKRDIHYDGEKNYVQGLFTAWIGDKGETETFCAINY